MVTLERMKSTVPSAPDLDRDIHKAAMQELGYCPGHQQLGRSDELRDVIKTCDELGIGRPFTNESVEAYKKDIYRKDRTNIILRIAAVLVAVLFVVSAFVIKASERDDAFFAIVLFGFMGAIVAGGILSNMKTWNQIILQCYQGPVPEFAIQTALDFKKRFGQRMTFEVEVFERTPDPFLVAVGLYGDRYYLEVWNEPKYKQERMA